MRPPPPPPPSEPERGGAAPPGKALREALPALTQIRRALAGPLSRAAVQDVADQHVHALWMLGKLFEHLLNAADAQLTPAGRDDQLVEVEACAAAIIGDIQRLRVAGLPAVQLIQLEADRRQVDFELGQPIVTDAALGLFSADRVAAFAVQVDMDGPLPTWTTEPSMGPSVRAKPPLAAQLAVLGALRALAATLTNPQDHDMEGESGR